MALRFCTLLPVPMSYLVVVVWRHSLSAGQEPCITFLLTESGLVNSIQIKLRLWACGTVNTDLFQISSAKKLTPITQKEDYKKEGIKLLLSGFIEKGEIGTYH